MAELFGTLLIVLGVVGALALGGFWLWRTGKLARFLTKPPAPPKP